jgi:hypothetical protein
MVFAFHTLEAYVNFIVEKLRPDMLKRPFAPFDKKLGEVLERVNLARPDYTTRPFRTVKELQELRNIIAHGRREVISETHRHSDTEDAPREKGFLETEVSRQKAIFSAQDVKRIARSIQTAARKEFPADPSLKGEPLVGILQIVSRSTSRVPQVRGYCRSFDLGVWGASEP